jgi:tetratricopeptide (TPR) repeat protein
MKSGGCPDTQLNSCWVFKEGKGSVNSPKCFGSRAAVLSVLLLQPCVIAQQGGQSGSNTGTTTRTDTSRPPGNRTQTQPSRGSASNTQPIYVSGTVILEDGTPPPSGTVIERDCFGLPRTQANVDVNGHFQFQLGGDAQADNNLLPEASDGPTLALDPFADKTVQPSTLPSSFGTLTNSNWMGCELRARLTGYTSGAVRLDGSLMSAQLEAGTIVLHPIFKVQGTRVSVTDLKAPNGARKSLERAQDALQKGNIAEAHQYLDRAVKAYPEYASAWVLLGEVLEREKRVQVAAEAYRKAISIDAKFLAPHIRLARLAGDERKWQEVVDLTDRALELDPLDFPDGYFLSAIANYNLENLDAAEKSARKGILLDAPHRFPKIHLVLANILHKKSDIPGALAEMKDYLKYAPGADDADMVRARLLEEEKLAEMLSTDQPAPKP